jgi:hypothetical protein
MWSQPTLVVAHGREVWCNEVMDALRREKCLCLNCGDMDSCPIAKTLYGVCKDASLALAVTRCPLWAPKR